MKYYFLSNSTDEEVIGKYPQCKGLPSRMGLTYEWFEQPNSMTKLTNEDFPEFKPELIFELEGKARLTDVVSPSNITAKGLLVNEKIKELFSQFKLMEHKYYPANLFFHGLEYQYYWLHFKDCEEKYLGGIDYQNSSFFLSNLAFMKVKDMSIISRDDFWDKKMNLPMRHIRATKLQLSNGLSNERLDLFYLPFIHSDFLVSNQLSRAIEVTDITGFEIREQSILD